MELFDAIKTRRSIRKYKAKPVEEEKIIKIIQSATLAPNSENEQPWKFIVLTNKEKKRKIAEISIIGGMQHYTPKKDKLDKRFQPVSPEKRKEIVEGLTSGKLFSFINKAPVLIIVLADNNYVCAVHSASAAIQNLLLAAHGLGLGTCWTMIGCLTKEHQDEIKELIGYAKNWEIAGIITLGYPDQNPKARSRKNIDEVIDWQIS